MQDWLSAVVVWPLAAVACWLLRPASRSARTAFVAVLVVIVFAGLRQCLHRQTLASPDALAEMKLNVSLLLVTVFCTVTRDVGAIVAIGKLGKMATESADPVDDELEAELSNKDSLAQRTAKHFRWWVIGAIAAMVLRYAIVGSMLVLGPVAWAGMIIDLPAFPGRMLFASPALVQLFPCWNVVLALFASTMAWHELVLVWQAERGEGLKSEIVQDPLDESADGQ